MEAADIARQAVGGLVVLEVGGDEVDEPFGIASLSGAHAKDVWAATGAPGTAARPDRPEAPDRSSTTPTSCPARSQRLRPAEVKIRWRHSVTDAELFELTTSHGGRAVAGWWDQIRQHSLGWVTARVVDGTLVGFLNVAWDGADHAFLLDTKTRPDHQRRGIATAVVHLAAVHARDAGCEWLHVDFERQHRSFYIDACGFRPTADAGLIHLHDLDDGDGDGDGEMVP